MTLYRSNQSTNHLRNKFTAKNGACSGNINPFISGLRGSLACGGRLGADRGRIFEAFSPAKSGATIAFEGNGGRWGGSLL